MGNGYITSKNPLKVAAEERRHRGAQRRVNERLLAEQLKRERDEILEQPFNGSLSEAEKAAARERAKGRVRWRLR